MSNKIEGGLVFHDCFGCGKEFREDDVSWATEDGKITFGGNPYCDACLPEEEDEEADNEPYRPPCDCDQSGSGYSLCSHCFAEQVGGE